MTIHTAKAAKKPRRISRVFHDPHVVDMLERLDEDTIAEALADAEVLATLRHFDTPAVRKTARPAVDFFDELHSSTR